MLQSYTDWTEDKATCKPVHYPWTSPPANLTPSWKCQFDVSINPPCGLLPRCV